MSSNYFNQNFNLTYGALQKILNGETVQNAILQILGYKEISGGNIHRFRLLLNDGTVKFSYAILATQLNNFIYEKKLEKYTIFKLKNYVFSKLQENKKVIICIDIELIVPGSEVNKEIFEKSNTVAAENDILNSMSITMSVREFKHSNTSEAGPSSSLDIFTNWDTAETNKQLSTEDFYSFIYSISPYTKWKIKARVIFKTKLLSYDNVKGQGKYFSFYLKDQSGEIKATAFNENAEKFYELLQLLKIYVISNANIKSSRVICAVKHDFELIIENYTKVEPYIGDEASVPMPTFNFHTIAEIISLPKDSYVDVIGLCDRVSECITIITKLNREFTKRHLTLIDNSKKSVTVTLWGTEAENFKLNSSQVLTIKNAKISDYGGCSLNVTSASMLYIDLEIPQTFELKAWFQTLDPSFVSQMVSLDTSHQTVTQNFKTLAQVSTDSNISRIPLYCSTKATIVLVKKEKCMYQACPSPGCLKKVRDLNNGLFRCDKCNKNYDVFNWMLLFSIEIADFTGSLWAVVFREMAENLIGMSSEELSKIKIEDEDKYNEILSNLNLKSYIFQMRSNLQVFNGENSLKTSVLNFSPVVPLVYTKRLIADIKRLNRIINHY